MSAYIDFKTLEKKAHEQYEALSEKLKAGRTARNALRRTESARPSNERSCFRLYA